MLLQGTGGVSMFALQFAKMAGARVIVTSSSDAKLERLQSMGARRRRSTTKPRRSGTSRCAQLTNGVGVDHVVEVGGAGTLPLSSKAVRRGGHIALIGVLAGRGEFDPRLMMLKGVRLQGIFVGSREMFEEMNRAIALAELRPVIDRVFGFGELHEALELSGKRRALREDRRTRLRYRAVTAHSVKPLRRK